MKSNFQMDKQFQLLENMLCQHDLTNDLWVASDHTGSVIFQSESFKQLTKKEIKCLSGSDGLLNKVKAAIKQNQIVHTIEALVLASQVEVYAWVCIEPLIIASGCWVAILQLQLINNNLFSKLIKKNALKSKTIEYQNLLSEDELQIINLLKQGYTQEQIAQQIKRSRSGTIYKIAKICKKMNLADSSSKQLKDYLRDYHD